MASVVLAPSPSIGTKGHQHDDRNALFRHRPCGGASRSSGCCEAWKRQRSQRQRTWPARAGRRRQRWCEGPRQARLLRQGSGEEGREGGPETRKAAREAEGETPADGPKHDNPAWVCKFERDQMGGDAFAERYGTNESKANAFGMCVSTEAHDRDGVSAERRGGGAGGRRDDRRTPAARTPPARTPARMHSLCCARSSRR